MTKIVFKSYKFIKFIKIYNQFFEILKQKKKN